MGQGASVLRHRVYAAAASFSPQEDQVDDESEGPPPAPQQSPLATQEIPGTAMIRCQKCRLVWPVECGTVSFSCENCGAKVLVALGPVAVQASIQASKHLTRARDALLSVIEEQAAVTQGFWEQLEEELSLAEAVWDSQPDPERVETAAQAHMLLREAIAAHDCAQVAEALTYASEVGLPPPSADFRTTLERLRNQEDLEVLWRCFLRALAAEDAIDLDFWRQEAETQGLHVPPAVTAAIAALQGAEKARMAEIEYATSLGDRAAQLAADGDRQGLQRLINESRLLGVDTSPAEAVLAALLAEGSEGGGVAGGDDAAGAPRVAADASAAAGADLSRMGATELRRLPISRLRAELREFGLEAEGLCEKDELIHVLLAARASQKEAAERAAQAQEAAAAAAEAAKAGAAGGASASSAGGDAAAGGGGGRSEVPGWGASFSTEPLQGEWWRNNGISMRISGDTITWADGTSARILPMGPSKFSVVLEGQTYHAAVTGAKLVWSDGDIWTRSPPARAQPQKPKPDEKAKRPLPPPPPRTGGPMTRKQALACLELTAEPTEDELRKAYKKAALRWHPDRRQNHDCADEAKEKFQEVRAAFELLQQTYARPYGSPQPR